MITISFARCKIASYAPCSKVLMRSNSNWSNHNAMKYESLHLTVQVILMYYVPFVTNKKCVHDVLNQCALELFIKVTTWGSSENNNVLCNKKETLTSTHFNLKHLSVVWEVISMKIKICFNLKLRGPEHLNLNLFLLMVLTEPTENKQYSGPNENKLYSTPEFYQSPTPKEVVSFTYKTQMW